MIRLANAPCSWGVLEFDVAATPSAPASQVLDEIADTGYAGTELGEWGFFPTEGAALAADLARRGLALAGAFVPVALARPDAIEEGIERAKRVARLLADAGAADASIVLSDDNATVPNRTARAGRIRPDDGLRASEWDAFADRASLVAEAVRAEGGVRTVFHPHVGGYVETPQEIDALMSRTDASLVGLCLDTGHVTYGGGDALAVIDAYGDRIRHVHFKDCDPRVLQRVRAEACDYHSAVRHGIFCELGRGRIPFADILDALRRHRYSGWIVVEQDVVAGMGTPAESARRNRDYLRHFGF